MYKSSKIYLYNGLALDEEMLDKLNIEEVNRFELLSLLQDIRTVIKLNNNGVVIAESPVVKGEIIANLEEEKYFLINRGKYIILPNIRVYYTITYKDEILCLFLDRTIRDSKLGMLNKFGINSIIDDIVYTKESAINVNAQREQQKIYKQLRYYSKNKLQD